MHRQIKFYSLGLLIHTVLSALLIVFLFVNVNAELCTRDEANLAADNWLKEQIKSEKTWAGVSDIERGATYELVVNDTLIAYVISVKPSGYLVISLLKELGVVVAHSDEGIITADNVNKIGSMIKNGLIYWQNEFFKKYGTLEASDGDSDNPLIKGDYIKQWDKYLNYEENQQIDDLNLETTETIGPLMGNIRWHQEYPFNGYCPNVDPGRDCSGCDPGYNYVNPCHAGCVAVSAAMIMKYWEWPPRGRESMTYIMPADASCLYVGVGELELSTDFNYDIEWDLIPASCDYPYSCSNDEEFAVGDLVFKIGKAFRTSYGVCSSSAHVYTGYNVFDDYFYYEELDASDFYGFTSETDLGEWSNIIRTELAAGRVILYGDWGNGCVCDGWNDSGFIIELHFVTTQTDFSGYWANINLSAPGRTGMLCHIRPDYDFLICSEGNVVAGSGIGAYGENLVDVPTLCDGGGLCYSLIDITRQSGYSGPLDHDGEMQNDAAIEAYDYGDSHFPLLSTDTFWDDEHHSSGLSANNNAALLYDFWLDNLSRNGYDDEGSSFNSLVDNYDDPEECSYNELDERVRYAPPDLDYYAGSAVMDVVAHEWAHGITHHSSNLSYDLNEPAALSEAFSEITSAFTCSHIGIPEDHIWEICELWKRIPYTRGDNLQDPHLSNPQRPKSYLSDPYWYSGSDVSEFAHQNRTVVGHMFYLLSEGGSLNGVNVEGVGGIDNAYAIMYDTNVRGKWPINCTFDEARKQCLRDAYYIFENDDWARQVDKAWNAVNVGCPYTAGDVNEDGQRIASDVTYMVQYLRGIEFNTQGAIQDCWYQDQDCLFQPAMDINGDCVINMADVIYYCSFFRGEVPGILHCVDFEPFEY